MRFDRDAGSTRPHRAERSVATTPVSTHAIDDQTAIKVIDAAVGGISKGHWRQFAPAAELSVQASPAD